MPSPRWSGHTVLVTGASSGIGAAIASRLAAAGARLLLTGRDPGRLEAVVSDCRDRGAAVEAAAGDLTEASFRGALVARLHETLGPVDMLVNNAGISMNAPFSSLEPETMRRIFEINFFAAAGLTRLLLDDLAEHSGRILVVSSVTGLVGTPTRTAYAASKHALHGLFNALRVELQPAGVGVTIICPGYVATPIRKRALLGDGRIQGRDQAAGRRMVSPEKVAAASLRAAWKRRRLVLLGSETRLARFLSIVAPSLLDAILFRATR